MVINFLRNNKMNDFGKNKDLDSFGVKNEGVTSLAKTCF